MSKVVADLQTNETLIRIGHFSHVECITLDEVRKPRTRRGRDGRPLPWGKTRTLANGIYPFGWAKLEFLDLETKSRPEKDWPFLLDDKGKGADKFVPDELVFKAKVKKGTGEGDPHIKKDKPVVQETISPLEKMLKELDIVKASDMGRIGTIIQKIDTLETDVEKGTVAKAIRDKIGPKAFKKHKRKEYLLELIEKV